MRGLIIIFFSLFLSCKSITMGSSDLNLKKSWHPSTFKNQERVWKEEQKRKEEERKLEQLKKELAEERQLQELQQMQEESGAK